MQRKLLFFRLVRGISTRPATIAIATILTITVSLMYAGVAIPSPLPTISALVDTSDACLIFNIDSPRARDANLARNCVGWADSQLVKAGHFADVYGPVGWGATRGAELAREAMCLSPDCRFRTTPLRVIVFKKGIASAYFLPNGSSNDVLLSSSLLDYALQANRAFVDDLLDESFTEKLPANPETKGRYGRWLDQIRAAGGTSCDDSLFWPRNAPIADRDTVRAQLAMMSLVSVMAFVVAHELAHGEFGDTCGATAAGLVAEMRCDSIAVTRLLRARKVALIFPATTLSALGVWEARTGPRIQTFNFKNDDRLLEKNPQRDWSARASKLIDHFEDYCVSTASDPSCRGAPELAAYLRSENARRKPAPCIEPPRKRGGVLKTSLPNGVQE